jgi:methyl-accepting chemotaxis protein
MVSMNPRLQTPVLKSIRDEYSWSFLVFTVRPDGANVARSDDKEPPYYGDRAYFKQVMEGAPLGRQVVISRTSGQPTLVLAVPIQTTDGRTVGVLATSTSLAELSEIVTKSKIGKTGYAFLLDEDGKVVAHYQQAYVNSSADFSKHPAFRGLAGEASRRLVYQEEGRDIVAYAQKTQHGWTMVVQRDYDDAYSAIGDANSQAFSLLVLTLAAVTVLAIVLARRLAGPIRRLTLIADEISRGRLDIAITEVGRKDEIGALAAAIDRMASGIRVSIHKLRRVR